MVATAPSAATEWTATSEAAIPVRSVRSSGATRPRSRRAPGARTATALVADTTAGLLAVLALDPLGPRADLALAVLWVAVATIASQRLRGPTATVRETARRVVGAGLVLVFLAVALAGALAVDLDPVRLIAFATAVSTLAFVHRGLASTVDARHPSQTLRVVVAGHRHGVEQMLAELRDAGSPVSVAAVCLTGTAHSQDFDTPVSVGFERLQECVREHEADAVIVVPCRQVDPAQLRRVGWQLERTGTQLFVGTGLRELGPGRTSLGHAGSLPLIRVRPAPVRGGQRIAKATWERLAAGLALIALSPLLLAIALLVRLESPGPAFFRQTRAGRDGTPFTMLKFRTMCVDAEDRLGTLAAQQPHDGVLFKLRDDPRITRAGRLLRRYSLDELPQLINILRGEMALVGPRPPLPSEVEQYDADIHRRLAVTPGLTGLWQVSGRSDLSWEESVRLDLRYVENWSIGLDVSILLRTAGAVLGHRGAY